MPDLERTTKKVQLVSCHPDFNFLREFFTSRSGTRLLNRANARFNARNAYQTMPRQSKPYFRQQTQSWYCSFGGKQIPLGKNKTEAHEKFYELMGRRDDIRADLAPSTS